MAFNLKKINTNSGPKQPNIEPGAYPARLVQLIDFGLQPQRPFQGQEKSPAYEIGLTYELLDEFMLDEDGNEIEDKPRWISETLSVFGLNSERAKSTQRYLALDPEMEYDGDFLALIGTPCMVTIVNNKGSNDKVYDNVANVSGMRAKEARNAAPLVNSPRIVNLDSEDTETFLSMPDWIQDKIKESLEWESTKLYKALQGGKGSKAGKAADTATTPASEAPRARKKASRTAEEEVDDSIPFDVEEPEVEEEDNW